MLIAKHSPLPLADDAYRLHYGDVIGVTFQSDWGLRGLKAPKVPSKS